MCISALVCMAQCDLEDVDCAFTCGMLALDNQPFLDISQCMADAGCVPDYPEDGICLAEDSQALQVLLEPSIFMTSSITLLFSIWHGPHPESD